MLNCYRCQLLYFQILKIAGLFRNGLSDFFQIVLVIEVYLRRIIKYGGDFENN